MSNIEKNDKQMKRRDLLRSLGSLAVGAGVRRNTRPYLPRREW